MRVDGDRRTIRHEGCSLSYCVRGDGPPVLLIQGVGVHGGGWMPQVDGLSKRYRCLWFDNRGMAGSQPLAGNLTVASMAEDALAILDAERCASAHLIGHSLGGLIALHLGLQARTRVRSLSLLCTFPRGGDAMSLSWKVLWTGLRTRIGTKPQRRRAFLEIVMPPGVLADADRDELAARLEPLFGHDLGEQPPVAMKQLGAMRGYDASKRLGELAGIPTLVVSAAFDPIAKVEVGRKMAAAIPGARFVELAEASHGAPIQCAARVNALLLEQLGRLA